MCPWGWPSGGSAKGNKQTRRRREEKRREEKRREEKKLSRHYQYYTKNLLYIHVYSV